MVFFGFCEGLYMTLWLSYHLYPHPSSWSLGNQTCPVGNRSIGNGPWCLTATRIFSVPKLRTSVAAVIGKKNRWISWGVMMKPTIWRWTWRWTRSSDEFGMSHLGSVFWFPLPRLFPIVANCGQLCSSAPSGFEIAAVFTASPDLQCTQSTPIPQFPRLEYPASEILDPDKTATTTTKPLHILHIAHPTPGNHQDFRDLKRSAQLDLGPQQRYTGRALVWPSEPPETIDPLASRGCWYPKVPSGNLT